MTPRPLTLAPAIAQCGVNIQDVLGASPQVLGELSSGRRSATELNNAIDAVEATLDGARLANAVAALIARGEVSP